MVTHCAPATDLKLILELQIGEVFKGRFEEK
jgi:hypothetical protein